MLDIESTGCGVCRASSSHTQPCLNCDHLIVYGVSSSDAHPPLLHSTGTNCNKPFMKRLRTENRRLKVFSEDSK